ncbi:MAG: recombination protein NinB, partial [Roseinatronobacter sp.]
FRTSRMSKSQMADLITFILEYGDRHGVNWSAQRAQT